MDRFIAPADKDNPTAENPLKSNMDRFIVYTYISAIVAI